MATALLAVVGVRLSSYNLTAIYSSSSFRLLHSLLDISSKISSSPFILDLVGPYSPSLQLFLLGHFSTEILSNGYQQPGVRLPREGLLWMGRLLRDTAKMNIGFKGVRNTIYPCKATQKIFKNMINYQVQYLCHLSTELTLWRSREGCNVNITSKGSSTEDKVAISCRRSIIYPLWIFVFGSYVARKPHCEL
jgi:hypothetical protein